MCRESFYFKRSNAALRSSVDQKGHKLKKTRAGILVSLASLVSWDLIGAGNILFLKYIEKGCIPRSQERHGREEKNSFQGFFFVERGVSFLGREDLGSELSEFSRR